MINLIFYNLIHMIKFVEKAIEEIYYPLFEKNEVDIDKKRYYIQPYDIRKSWSYRTIDE
ncbi:hypothetical protein SGA02_24270 [Staphylococcus gallinarum]|uniref:Uncharacterized protein n=1 Tax=Staphylococcus gallinarum TaxID=1293 RepID=A0ABQ0Y5C0_STAGA|nr:hypothetical protein SGA02_24270 [Staphylococcus gallinarum]